MEEKVIRNGTRHGGDSVSMKRGCEDMGERPKDEVRQEFLHALCGGYEIYNSGPRAELRADEHMYGHR